MGGENLPECLGEAFERPLNVYTYIHFRTTDERLLQAWSLHVDR